MCYVDFMNSVRCQYLVIVEIIYKQSICTVNTETMSCWFSLFPFSKVGTRCISQPPDLGTKIWGKIIGLYTGIYGNYFEPPQGNGACENLHYLAIWSIAQKLILASGKQPAICHWSCVKLAWWQSLILNNQDENLSKEQLVFGCNVLATKNKIHERALVRLVHKNIESMKSIRSHPKRFVTRKQQCATPSHVSLEETLCCWRRRRWFISHPDTIFGCGMKWTTSPPLF